MPLTHLGIKTREASIPFQACRRLDSSGAVVDASVWCCDRRRWHHGSGVSRNTRNTRDRSLFGHLVSRRNVNSSSVSSEEQGFNDEVAQDEEASCVSH